MSQPPVQITADASFFTLVHELIEAEKSFAREHSTPADQRAADRRQFDCQQLLAPFDGIRLPSQSEFRQVICQDISPGGFSFVLEDRAEFDELVVALGQVPFKFFTARVANQTRIRHRGGFGYRIGCRFTGRIVAD